MAKISRLISKHPWVAYPLICLVAVVDALVSIVLLYPNDFAPVGIQGFVTMIQHMMGISVGYLFLIVNAPLLVLAFFLLTKGYSFKNLSYILTFSGATVVAQWIIARFNLSFLEFQAKTDEQALLAAALYGVFFGIGYPIAVWLGGSTGGTDIMAALINKLRPSFNTVWVLFAINAAVAAMSYFVYGRQVLPVVLSVVCSLISGFISDLLLKGATSALKFEIVTASPEAMSAEIMEKLDHGCTKLPATGMYSGADCAMLVCIINKKQRIEMEKIIASYEGSFGFCSPVKSTYGYFEKIK